MTRIHTKTRFVLSLTAMVLSLVVTTAKAQQSLDSMLDREIAQLVSTYKMLHAAPELSHHEEKTSAFLATQVRALGFTVTEGIGQYEGANFSGYVGVGAV